MPNDIKDSIEYKFRALGMALLDHRTGTVAIRRDPETGMMCEMISNKNMEYQYEAEARYTRKTGRPFQFEKPFDLHYTEEMKKNAREELIGKLKGRRDIH